LVGFCGQLRRPLDPAVGSLSDVRVCAGM
jgi:hypothetical protein